jgi:hypothetical protein
MKVAEFSSAKQNICISVQNSFIVPTDALNNIKPQL